MFWSREKKQIIPDRLLTGARVSVLEKLESRQGQKNDKRSEKCVEEKMFILENETLRVNSQLVFKYLIKLGQIKSRRKKISITVRLEAQIW